jgi:hypothetical protein
LATITALSGCTITSLYLICSSGIKQNSYELSGPHFPPQRIPVFAQGRGVEGRGHAEERKWNLSEWFHISGESLEGSDDPPFDARFPHLRHPKRCQCWFVNC